MNPLCRTMNLNSNISAIFPFGILLAEPKVTSSAI